MTKDAPPKKRRPRIVRMIAAWGMLLGALAGIGVLLYWVIWPTGARDPRSFRVRDGTAASGDNPVISFFYSCDIEGRLAPYACEEGALGGVARASTVYSNWAKDRPYHILLDAGNSTVSGHDTAETINKFTFNALDKLGYDVVNCGDNEATLGLQELRALSKERKFKLISANLVHAETRAPILPAHHIVRRAGLRIAIIGVLREDILPKHPGKGVRLISPADALRGAINVVKDSADIIVVLAYLPPEEIHELARKYRDVHVFLGGISPVNSAPFEIAGPRAAPASVVSYLGDQGCSVACLDCVFPKGQLPIATSRLALLDEAVPADKAFVGLLAEFTSALSGKPMPGARQDPTMPCTSKYIGSEVCKLCHNKQYYSWQKTDHAGAYATLIEKGMHKEPACLGCHTTGYLMPGGYDPSLPTEPQKAPEKEKDALKATRSPASQLPLQGVGCECCHGGARHHLGLALRDKPATARTPLLRTGASREKPTGASYENCIRCHTPSRPCLARGAADTFERTEYMEKIKHRK